MCFFNSIANIILNTLKVWEFIKIAIIAYHLLITAHVLP